MRKSYLMALMGSLCLWLTVPGTASANHDIQSQILVMDQGEMDPALLQSILLNVQAECDMDLAVLNGMYVSGELTIVSAEEGYVVASLEGGLIMEILLEDL